MKRFKLFFLSLALGVAIGGAGSWFVFANETQEAPAPAKQPNKTKEVAVPKNLETMTLSEMTDKLKNAPDDEFERQYLAVAIQLGNYTTAINRIAKERAERDTLREFSETYYGASSDLTRQLADWQKAWGYNHH